MNKCRAPKIPPLLVNNVFILNCRDKAKVFNDFFRISAGISPTVVHYPYLIFSLVKELTKSQLGGMQ